MFSTSTEGDMFTGAFCSRCRFAFEGDQLCDEAAPITWGDPPPDFLVRVPLSEANPVGVTCTRFESSGRDNPVPLSEGSGITARFFAAPHPEES